MILCSALSELHAGLGSERKTIAYPNAVFDTRGNKGVSETGARVPWHQWQKTAP